MSGSVGSIKPKDINPLGGNSGSSKSPPKGSLEAGYVSTITTPVTSFFSTVLLGAEKLVKTVTYIMFYPFTSHYETTITPERKEILLKTIKKGSDSEKFEAFTKAVRTASANYGDVSAVKEVVVAFAGAQKEVFEKIAVLVLGTDTKYEVKSGQTIGDVVLAGIDSGEITIIDLHHGVNLHLVGTVTDSQEQFQILNYQVYRAETSKTESPHTKKLFLAFADTNVKGFKKLAAYLSEVDKTIKAKDDKSLEAIAKKWIDGPELYLSVLRKALDLRLVDVLIGRLKNKSPSAQPKILHAFFSEKRSDTRNMFMGKSFLEKVAIEQPELMTELSDLMVKFDSGLQKAEKPSGAEKCVQKWAKSDSFSYSTLVEGVQQLWGHRISKGVSDEAQPLSLRLNVFDTAIDFSRVAFLPKVLSTFLEIAANKDVATQFIQYVLKKDAELQKRSATEGFIRLKDGATSEEEQKAVIEAAERVSTLHRPKDGATIQAFRGMLRYALGIVQAEQFEKDLVGKDIPLAERLKVLSLLVDQTAIEAVDAKFARENLVTFSQIEPNAFGDLAVKIAKDHASEVGVKAFELAAGNDVRHPQKVKEARNALGKLYYGAPAEQTTEEIQNSNREVYGKALIDYLKKSTDDTDFVWLARALLVHA